MSAILAPMGTASFFLRLAKEKGKKIQWTAGNSFKKKRKVP